MTLNTTENLMCSSLNLTNTSPTVMILYLRFYPERNSSVSLYIIDATFSFTYWFSCSYLFASLPSLTTRVLTQSLHKIRGMNKYGILKMRRNTFSLQQNFTNMNIAVSEPEFDRVRRYYGLLDGKPKVFTFCLVPRKLLFNMFPGIDRAVGTPNRRTI